jgi:uncharacterized protein YbjT (DUF2867 family)
MAYAVMGITGQVGGAVARHLLAMGKQVRGIVRDPAKARKWELDGVELALSESGDAPALTTAFRATEGVFVMLPPLFAPSPDFREARAIADALAQALATARPAKVVVLSTIGGHRDHGVGILAQLHILEKTLAALSLPTAVVRAAWFMENALWDVESAKAGTISSFLSPLDRAFPMVATDDIGRVIAETLTNEWSESRVMELEGPRRYSPNDLAAAFAGALGREVSATIVPRASWESLFRSQGAADPASRIEMLDGFNSSWIEFAGAPAIQIKGNIELDAVIRSLVPRE